jgi:hypothetical protein
MLVGAEVGLLVGEVLVLEKVLKSELGLASLGVEDAEALVEEGLEDVEVVNEAAAEFVESAEITVNVEYGYESRLVVALVEQQSCP